MSVDAVNNSNYQAQEAQNYSQNNVNSAQETGAVETQSYSSSSNSGSSGSVSDDVEMSPAANNTRRSRVASLDDMPEEEYYENTADAAHEAEAAAVAAYDEMETAGETSSKGYERSEETDALIDDMVGKYAEENGYDLDSKAVQEFRDNIIVLGGTDKADKINVTNSKEGGIDVEVNGKVTHYTAEQAKYLVIDAGKGDDEVTVADDVTIGMHIAGGEGDDVLKGGAGNDVMYDYYGKTRMVGGAGDDQLVAHGLSKDGKTVYDNIISGGEGNDYIEGGAGNDLIHGGDGNDVIYGLSGDDTIYGGEGHDYIDGGKGNDSIDGGNGNDRLVGGEGDDNLLGGAGDDLLIGAHGVDHMDGGSGADKLVGQKSIDDMLNGPGDEVEERYSVTLPKNLYVEADGLEAERIYSDLEMLASTENGAKMFSAISVGDGTVTIRTTKAGNQIGWNQNNDGSMTTAVDYNLAKISLGNKELPWNERAPIVGLFHELCHSYNALTHTLDTYYYDAEGNKYDKENRPKDKSTVRGLEYQAVGMEHEHADIDQNDPLLTENGIRDFLGYERREKY
ncbi:MAG: M91 family zinc metallopeptidase [bacterium]|nr:M91 family zinc metallopeptidase [bacterium]